MVPLGRRRQSGNLSLSTRERTLTRRSSELTPSSSAAPLPKPLAAKPVPDQTPGAANWFEAIPVVGASPPSETSALVGSAVDTPRAPSGRGFDKLLGRLQHRGITRERSQSMDSAPPALWTRPAPPSAPKLPRSRRSGSAITLSDRNRDVVRRHSDDSDAMSMSSSGDSEEEHTLFARKLTPSSRTLSSRLLVAPNPSTSPGQSRRPSLRMFSSSAVPDPLSVSRHASMTSVPTRQSWVSVKNATSHSAPPFTNVRVVGPIPSNTSLAYQAVFGELAIKCELKSGEVLSTTTTSAASAEATETAEPRTGVCSAITALETADVSMVRINEHKPDFSALERQLESIYSFAKRGVEPELWYTDTDGDTLRLQDSVGLTYAVEDWRHSLHPTRRRKTGSGSNTAAASMRLFIHQRRP